MSFLKRFFAADPMAALRRAAEQKRWAEAIGLAQQVDCDRLTPEQREERESLLALAGDRLAEINLSEGEAFLRAGEQVKALEHFALAAEQARSTPLRKEISRYLDLQETPALPEDPDEVVAEDSAACPPGCSSSGCAPAPAGPVLPEPESGIDSHTRREFILAAYPPAWTERYERLEGAFLEGFLRSHEGREKEALDLFEQVPDSQRDDLFFFERGSLLARLGDIERGGRDLEQAVALNPVHELAMETLVYLDMAANRQKVVEARLAAMMDQGISLPFCHDRLAELSAARKDFETALHHCGKALELGGAEAETLIVVAGSLEGAGREEDAEELLQYIEGDGCGGSVNLPLAEFWLRQGKKLDLALESFKEALRRAPDNPRWLLRIAQVYWHKGWQKEAVPLLERLLALPGLDPELFNQGKALLHSKEQG